VNPVVALSGPVDSVPDASRLPAHPPEAVHELTLVLDQVSTELPPATTEVGLALNDSEGAPGVNGTVTVVER
jgi:hypothetical protein